MHLHLDRRPYATQPAVVAEDGRYRPVSYWQETVSVTPGPPLTEDVSCDVAIVGGGFTGLSTACELKRSDPSLNVVVLERAVVGHGASGRNGGFVMPLIGWDLLEVARALGEETCGHASRLMYDAVAHTKQLIRDRRIDCDLEETGYLFLATCEARKARIRDEVDLAHRLGYRHRRLEGADLDEYVRSDGFLAGVFDPEPAVVNPAKLARGLKTLAEEAGAIICEQTPLEEFTEGRPHVLRTPHATVRADQVVLGVNGYGAALGFMGSRVFPVHTYIVLTEPIDAADLEAIGWGRHRASLETDRNFIHYFRLTADNRILFGGEDVALFYGGKLIDHDERTYRGLEARFRRYFPSLSKVRFSHRWGGVLGVTIDMFPSFGQAGPDGTIFHATGYSGHGVALANYAGKVLAPHILKKAGRDVLEESLPRPFFFDRKPSAIPLQPLRYVGLQAYRGTLHAQDWWQGA